MPGGFSITRSRLLFLLFFEAHTLTFYFLRFRNPLWFAVAFLLIGYLPMSDLGFLTLQIEEVYAVGWIS